MAQAPRTNPSQNPAELHRRAVRLLQSGQLGQGIALLKQALEFNPGSANLHKDIGTAYWQSGQPEKAEEHYGKAFKLAPKDPLVLNCMGSLVTSKGDYNEAEKLLGKAMALAPQHPEIVNNLGLVYYHAGALERAEELFKKARTLAPKWPNPLFNLGLIYKTQDKLNEAYQAFRETLNLNSHHALAWFELGDLMNFSHDLDEAKRCYENALRYFPQHEKSWLQLIGVLEQKGMFDEARQVINGARQFFARDNPALAQVEAKIERREGNLDKAISIIEEVLPGLNKESYKNASTFFELGLLYDRANRIAEAFEAFTIANNMHKNNPAMAELDFDHMPNKVRMLAAGCNETLVNRIAIHDRTGVTPANGHNDPVFLVGFPRSGTTLLEQILKSHPDISVTEERPAMDATYSFLEELAGKDFPVRLADLGEEQIARARDYYFQTQIHYGADLSATPILVDKMPFNFIYTPIIRLLFPKAKFLMALRHPCDCVLSCFMQNFGFNNGLIHFLDIQDAAQTYDQNFSAWRHFTQTLPLQVYNHRYEDLVTDFRPSVEKILSFIGADWNDAVLEYDKTAKEGSGVYTPSYHQVTEKIYTRASGRWLRYRQQLEPVLDILAPWADSHGYAMEE